MSDTDDINPDDPDGTLQFTAQAHSVNKTICGTSPANDYQLELDLMMFGSSFKDEAGNRVDPCEVAIDTKTGVARRWDRNDGKFEGAPLIGTYSDVEYEDRDGDMHPLIEGRWYLGRYRNRAQYRGEHNCALWRDGLFWQIHNDGMHAVEMHDFDYLEEADEHQR